METGPNSNSGSEYCRLLHNGLYGSPWRWSIFLTLAHPCGFAFLYLQIISVSRQNNTLAHFPVTYLKSEVTHTDCYQLCTLQNKSGYTSLQKLLYIFVFLATLQ